MPLAWISLTLSRHFSLSFIASGRSSGLYPVSSHSCCMYVLAGRPVFARPYVGVHRSTSLMSLSLLLQQCPACLVCLTWIVFVMGGRWPYSWCFVGCCHQESKKNQPINCDKSHKNIENSPKTHKKENALFFVLFTEFLLSVYLALLKILDRCFVHSHSLTCPPLPKFSELPLVNTFRGSH